MPLKNIALKAILAMPPLLLQKPSKTSKAKDQEEGKKGRRKRHRTCKRK